MVGTSLASLAENIDGCVWPIKDPQERPMTYIELDYPAVLARLASLGQPPATLDGLADILRGTLAFDESFGEMVEVASKAGTNLDPVPRNLERLGIPLDFPVRLCAFKSGTLDFCRRERIVVIADFLTFSRGASQQVVIGGEFRDLLNSITHVDEETIARFLPFRVKSTGLHFVEGLGHLARELTEEQRQQIFQQPLQLPEHTREKNQHLAAYFKNQLDEMRASFVAGTPISRLVAPLGDLPLEAVVAALLRAHLQPPAAPAKRGFFQRLFGLGK